MTKQMAGKAEYTEKECMAGKMKFSERKQGLVTDKFKVGYGKRSFFRMSI